MNNPYLDKINLLLCNVLFIEDLSNDEDLFEAGYLDSLGIVNIIVALEEEFQVTLPMEDMNLEEFQSVESICNLVAPLIRISAES